MGAAAPSRWLFSPAADLLAFGGSAALSFALLAVGWRLGLLDGDKADTPEWAWVAAVLLVDVAHVWSTLFRVYLDPAEFRRRPGTYLLVPAAGLVGGVALYDAGPAVFWRCLAYLAVFHFVRQQYGWVMLYRAKLGERTWRGLDAAAIYLATVYPLVYWHAHLPRRFAWFLRGDFAELPAVCAEVLEPVYWLTLAAYFARSAWGGFANPGKDVVVLTTAACWYVGVVWFDSDYAFTVTNVVIHGVPYFVLVYWYRWGRGESRPRGWHLRTAAAFVAVVWVLAFAEELLWDRLVWHDRDWLFGDGWDARQWRWLAVPLLALPQLTHYLLDGLVWRRRGNPGFTLAGR
ncbi:hypothetical protein [Urbifossiella limnaea]|uniref:Uncharacterized protein n=1 Tax=Urbifossiella limnaea TaxID=2528023 RepID=A0A517Y1Q0_9BACT|nr:hypothetical protein [Urbifossiella limnaea]QDU23664.1 hypothetical protein ETAA1_56690 [Urbifossiella limnaea]